MYGGRKVVVVTPAGRRRYLEILSRYVLASPYMDQWQLWVNTEDLQDLAWMLELTVCESTRGGRVEAFFGGDPSKGNANIHTFYPNAAEPDTIYVRLDDDIVWLAPDFFEQLLDSRLGSPDTFLLSANVVNNAICDHLHQRTGALGFQRGAVGYACMDPTGWNNPAHAEYAHRSFLADAGSLCWRRWRFPDWTLFQGERFSINAICWTGEDMQKVLKLGGVGLDEEANLACSFPLHLQKWNKIAGRAVCSHFAYHTQRDHLDQTDLLDQYRRLAETQMPDDEHPASASHGTVSYGDRNTDAVAQTAINVGEEGGPSR